MKKIMSVLAASTVAASLLAGTVPVTALADGTMVVSIGADLTEDQKTAILKYFGIYGNNAVQTITVTNQDERNHLASYIPIEQIGSRTISCALVKPTTSGGVQVKTANLDYITSNMIASNLITCGVTNCQAIAAAPFEVSGTGALTGILMAYENATGTQISQEVKDLSAQEIQITEDLTNTTENQQVAQQIVNDVKLQVLDGTVDSIDNSENTDNSVITDNSVDNSKVENIVNNVVNNYNTDNSTTTSGMSEEEVQKLTDYAVQLAQQAYNKGVEDTKAQIAAQAQVQQNLQDQTGVQSTDTTTNIVDESTAAENQQADESQLQAADDASQQTEAPADDIFAGTDVSALNSGDTTGTLVTGTDTALISNDTAEGAQNNDALISDQTEVPAAETTAETDASGLVITTTDSNTTAVTEAPAAGTPASDAAETPSTEITADGIVAPAAETTADGTVAPAAETTADGTVAPAAETTADGTVAPAAETPADGTVAPATETPADGTAAAASITSDMTDSYSAAYLNTDGITHVPGFVLALKSDNLVPVSGTLTVTDESGNVLATADLADKAQVTAVTAGAYNDEFKTASAWDQLTGLFFQPKDASGAVVVPAAGTNYMLTLSGTFAQTADPAAVDGAPQVAVDLQNVLYTEPVQATAGLDTMGVALDGITAGGTFTATVIDDGTFTQATVTNPDGTAGVATSDNSGTVYAGADMTVYVTLQNAPGLVEIDVAYATAGEAMTEADGTQTLDENGNPVIGEATPGATIRYFIPVQ